jgi:hypothetical protein
MRCLCVLWVTWQLASVLPAIERASTLIGTLERSYPCLCCSSAICSDMRLATLLLLCSVMTQNVFLYLTTIATCWHPYLTGATRAIVTWTFTLMLSARHQPSTDVAAAPTVFVVGINTTSSD